MTNALTELIAEETARDVPAPVRAFAAQLAAGENGAALAVLFYGSSLRTGDLDGLLDFYVLTGNLKAGSRHRTAALFSRLLPPYVEYREHQCDHRTLRAKVAVLTPGQFARAVRFSSYDTTIWARFSQPSAIVWARDSTARDSAIALLTGAVTTAARWAALLGPPSGKPADFWRALYSQTYSVELRVEGSSRSADIVTHAENRYTQILESAWKMSGISYFANGLTVLRNLSPAELANARRAWTLRRIYGKPLNIFRLVKAAFTFNGGAAYLAWKIERHTQIALELTPWQKRHPILAAPAALWQLWRRGVLR